MMLDPMNRLLKIKTPVARITANRQKSNRHKTILTDCKGEKRN
jgi:hypothetical protein